MEEDKVMRLCMRVADPVMFVPASAVTGNCNRCSETVWLDEAQELPAEARGKTMELICIQCAMENAEMWEKITAGLPEALLAWITTGIAPGIRIDTEGEVQ